jgi:DNA-binding HxlR family transcriptional regulator
MASPTTPSALDFAPPRPAVDMANCPIGASLGVLGRKWTLTILREVAFFPGASFSRILKGNPGLRQRTLSLRLRQLAKDGIIARSPAPTTVRKPGYELTVKGRAVWPVLGALVQFGVQTLPDRVFADGQARNIVDVFPDSADLILGPLADYARGTATPTAVGRAALRSGSATRGSRARG